MIDIAHFSKRIRRRSLIAGALFLIGAGMLVVDYTTPFPTVEKGQFALLWFFLIGVGVVFYYFSLELPRKEIMQLAQDKKGLLTVGEITTALNVDPSLVLRTLRHLQRTGCASPRWAELQKNLWEFPDYVQLPISEAIDIAREQGGKLTLQDLIAQGQPLDVAQQTLDLLQEKNLAHPASGEDRRAMVLNRA